MTTVVILLTSIGLAAAGQLLLKAGMNQVGVVAGIDSFRAVVDVAGEVLGTWQVIAGLGAFGVSAAFWLVALSRVPLSVAYPVASFSYVLILVFSVVILGERPAALVWLGAILVMFGISLIGIGQR